MYPLTVARVVGSLVGSDFCRLTFIYIYIRSKNYAGYDAFTSYYEQDLYLVKMALTKTG